MINFNHFFIQPAPVCLENETDDTVLVDGELTELYINIGCVHKFAKSAPIEFTNICFSNNLNLRQFEQEE